MCSRKCEFTTSVLSVACWRQLCSLYEHVCQRVFNGESQYITMHEMVSYNCTDGDKVKQNHKDYHSFSSFLKSGFDVYVSSTEREFHCHLFAAYMTSYMCMTTCRRIQNKLNRRLKI